MYVKKKNKGVLVRDVWENKLQCRQGHSSTTCTWHCCSIEEYLFKGCYISLSYE